MSSLDEFLDYECRGSERYRRAMSLIILGVPGGEICFRTRAGDLVRGSDKVIGLNGTVAIVMGETPLEGALCAIARYATRYGNGTGLQCGAAGFPQDAHNARDLQSIALRRYEAAKTQGGYALVWKD
jgi:hypothetical protein